MGKGLGITALVIAIIAIFIPIVGTWLTVLVALLACCAAGQGFGMGIASIVISAVHIFFLSPTMWAVQGLTSAGSSISGESVPFTPWILLGIQAVALIILISLNKKVSTSQ